MAPVQPNASVAATGLGIRYIGQYCYAYSGEITTTDTSSAYHTALKFNTGTNTIVCKVQYTYSGGGNETSYLQIKMDGQTVMNAVLDAAGAASELLDMPFDLVIPPETNVQIKCGDNAGSKIYTVMLSGRAY